METRSLLRRFICLSACLLFEVTAGAQQSAVEDPFSRPKSWEVTTSQVAIDRTFESNGTVVLDHATPIVGATLDATLELPRAASLVRVVLEDSAGHEHLMYEAYPVLSGASKIELQAKCEETCVLPGIVATALKVQVIGAKVRLTSVGLSSPQGPLPMASIQATARKWKKRQGTYKVRSLEANIRNQGLRWTPGKTAISEMSYSEKKALFGGAQFVPNLQGFEFYRAGIFDLADESPMAGGPPSWMRGDSTDESQASRDFPESWDWRDAHGENWVTPVKNQAQCGSCWAFGAVAALETSINLYYNQHLNIDLSEQDMVSCAHIGGCSGALPSSALGYIKKNGIADSACFPYKGHQVSCSQKCNDWEANAWKVTEYGTPDRDDASLKETIYHKGVIGFGISSWSHEMAAVGYKPDRAFRGRTLWLIKNSWGAKWGDHGYTTMTVSQGNRAWDVYVDHPFFASDSDKYEIECVDEGDGQCYWGISPEKPASCPATCKN